jgi:hypothetical protein
VHLVGFYSLLLSIVVLATKLKRGQKKRRRKIESYWGKGVYVH